MKKKIIISLIVIWLTISLFVRLKGLDRSPISVGFDEASLGYNAYSIMLTGKDEYGNPYPLSLRSFNDFKPALYAYLSIPFIYFFDLSQTTIRAPSAFMGTVSLLFLLLIFKQVSKASWIKTIIIAAVISFFPWRLHFSRIAFESNISMAFFTGAVWCLMNFNKNKLFKFGAIAFSTLSIYSYHSSRLAIPLLLIFVVIDPLEIKLRSLFHRPLPYLKKLWLLFIVLILYIPLFLEASAGNILTRFNQTNVFSQFYPYTPDELIYSSNIWLNLIAHPFYYLNGIIFGHVFAYISPQNLALLLYPGVIKSAQVISGSGMLGFVGGTLFIIGFVTTIKSIFFNKEKRILLYWFFAGIAPAIITWEWYYPLRALNTFPVLDIIAGLGLLWIINKTISMKNLMYKSTIILTTFVIIIMSFAYNISNEYNYGAWESNGEFQPGGFKEGSDLLMSLKDEYKKVYIDSSHAQSHTIFWFYMKYPPANIQKIADLRNRPGEEMTEPLRFDNFEYRNFHWPTVKKENDFAFWTSSEVKNDEINSVPGTKIYKINSPLGNTPATIITKK